jgi:hypothetical protein
VKKTLLLLLLICVKFSAMSQSVSFNDLLGLADGKDETTLLKAKGFKMSVLKRAIGPLIYYTANKSGKIEHISVARDVVKKKQLHSQWVEYSTNEKPYIDNLMTQITKAGFWRNGVTKLPGYTHYFFDMPNVYAQATIIKSGGMPSTLMVHHRH